MRPLGGTDLKGNTMAARLNKLLIATTAAALTTVLTNPALNPNAKNGYDFGIKHKF